MRARPAATALAGVLLFAGFLAWLFPTDAVVARLLARATPPGSPAVAFTHASLRPDGIQLEGVTVRLTGTARLVHADAVRLRPSAWGLVHDGRGLPWRIDARACGGAAEATVAADGPGIAVTVSWDDADLAACPPLAIAGGALAGRARGVARLRLPPSGLPEGDGHVDLAGATWQGGGLLASLGPLHAEAASVRWTLRAGRLAFEALDLHGPEVSASGSGALELSDPLEESGVELTLAVTPAPDVRGPFGLLLRLAGADAGVRRLRVGGTLSRPSALLE